MKITVEMIESRIVNVEYLRVGKKTTLCILTLQNGFEIIGKSACVDPIEFDFEIGKQLAYRNAFDQIWQLEGYTLANSLHVD